MIAETELPRHWYVGIGETGDMLSSTAAAGGSHSKAPVSRCLHPHHYTKASRTAVQLVYGESTESCSAFPAHALLLQVRYAIVDQKVILEEVKSGLPPRLVLII